MRVQRVQRERFPHGIVIAARRVVVSGRHDGCVSLTRRVGHHTIGGSFKHCGSEACRLKQWRKLVSPCIWAEDRANAGFVSSKNAV